MESPLPASSAGSGMKDRPASSALPTAVLALAKNFAEKTESATPVIEEEVDYARAFQALENDENDNQQQPGVAADVLSHSVQSPAPTRSEKLSAEEEPRAKKDASPDTVKGSDIEKNTDADVQAVSPPAAPTREEEDEEEDEEKIAAEGDDKEIAPLGEVARATAKIGRGSSSSSSFLSRRGGSKSRGKGSGSADTSKTTSNFGYVRVVQNRSKWGTFEEQDASVKKSAFSLFKDRVGSLFKGETAEERQTRLRLEWYRKTLETELGVVEGVKKDLEQHRLQLMVKFEDQKAMLLRNGLAPLIPRFEMQAWARVARTVIVATMADQALDAFYSRYKRSAKVIELFSSETKSKAGAEGGKVGSGEGEKKDKSEAEDGKEGSINKEMKGRKYDLETYNNFCIKPELVLAKESGFVSYSKRLMRMDKVVSNTQHIFSKKSSQLSSTYSRVPALHSMVREYLPLITEKEVPDLDKDSVTWLDLCSWYTTRQSAILDVETRFGNFIDDLREREGRLFDRWVKYNLRETEDHRWNLDKNGSASQVPSGSAGASSDGGGGGGGSQNRSRGKENPVVLQTAAVSATKDKDKDKDKDKERIESDKEPGAAKKGVIKVTSPRSVLAFVQYYANLVLGPQYGLKEQPENLSTLKQLTEALVYSRISSRLMRYTSDTIWARDLHWLYKCCLAKYVNPVIFGIPAVYLEGPPGQRRGGDSKEGEATANARNGPIKGEVINVKADLANLCDELTPVNFLARSTPLLGRPLAQGGGNSTDYAGLQTGHYATPYWRVSKLLSLMTSTTNPKELCNILLLSVKWLMKEAVAISQKGDYLGADTVFPILVLSLVYADIPNIHLILHYLHDYGEISDAGEESYYMTCLEAAVEYIIGLTVSPEIVEGVKKGIAEGKLPPHGGLEDVEDDAAFQRLTMDQQRFEVNQKNDIEDLGAWLRDQQTMEDTISILQKEGWMLRDDGA